MNRSISLLLAITTFVLSSVRTNAQAFKAGDNVVGLGVGAGGYYRGYGAYAFSSPLITVHFDHGMGFNAGPGIVGIGGYIGFKSFRDDGFHGYYYSDIRSNHFIIGTRGTYHWNDWHGIDQLDTYAGVFGGIDIVSINDRTNVNNALYVSPKGGVDGRFGVFAGGRWYFSDAFGAFAEVSHGDAFITAGLNLKF